MGQGARREGHGDVGTPHDRLLNRQRKVTEWLMWHLRYRGRVSVEDFRAVLGSGDMIMSIDFPNQAIRGAHWCMERGREGGVAMS